MSIVQMILLLLQAAPQVIESIKHIDTAIRGAHKGAEKKAILMAAFANAPTPVQDAAGAFIDSTVATLKAAGELPSHPTEAVVPVLVPAV